MIRLLWFLILMLMASACGVVDAVESFFISSDEAAQAATEAAEQTSRTLHALEHLFLAIPFYIAGEARKPLWGKIKSLNGRRKKKAAA